MLLQLIIQNDGPIGSFGGSVDENALLIGVFKLLFILVSFFYVMFAVIVVRQVQIMKNTLITPISPVLLILSILHLIISVIIFALFILVL